MNRIKDLCRKLADWLIVKLGGYTRQHVVVESRRPPSYIGIRMNPVRLQQRVEIPMTHLQNCATPGDLQFAYHHAMENVARQVGWYLLEHDKICFTAEESSSKQTVILTGAITVLSGADTSLHQMSYKKGANWF